MTSIIQRQELQNKIWKIANDVCSTVVLSNNTEIEVSRRKKDGFISRMKEFYKY